MVQFRVVAAGGVIADLYLYRHSASIISSSDEI